MALAIVYSRASSGIAAPLVTVEIHISHGMAGLHIVGLPEAAVKESKDRVRSALMNTSFEFPIRRITVNLAPADLPKEGGRFDLPIALGILVASEQLPAAKLTELEFTGELALAGELRAVRGVLPMVLSATKANRQLIVPQANAHEAALVKHAKVFSAEHLLQVCAYLKGEENLVVCSRPIETGAPTSQLDLTDVRGQTHAKRALEVAAAGKHSLLLMGPPGTGKTMLASRLPTILPNLTDDEALEVAAVTSISSNGFSASAWQALPFRAPHHTSSNVALVGGGRPPRPGEISLAHHGVLFLDELPEFSRHVLESLREPLESGHITISRAAFQTVFPAAFQLIAAMNPCPCGYFGNPQIACRCTPQQVQRYLDKLSGPLLDRLDMQIEVPSIPPKILSSLPMDNTQQSVVVKERVLRAREQQFHRQGKCNRDLSAADIRTFCVLDDPSTQLMSQVMTKFNWSARVYHRIIKLARTIADLEEQAVIQLEHVSEAITYRCLDRLKLSV